MDKGALGYSTSESSGRCKHSVQKSLVYNVTKEEFVQGRPRFMPNFQKDSMIGERNSSAMEPSSFTGGVFPVRV